MRPKWIVVLDRDKKGLAQTRAMVDNLAARGGPMALDFVVDLASREDTQRVMAEVGALSTSRRAQISSPIVMLLRWSLENTASLSGSFQTSGTCLHSTLAHDLFVPLTACCL